MSLRAEWRLSLLASSNQCEGACTESDHCAGFRYGLVGDVVEQNAYCTGSGGATRAEQESVVRRDRLIHIDEVILPTDAREDGGAVEVHGPNVVLRARNERVGEAQVVRGACREVARQNRVDEVRAVVVEYVDLPGIVDPTRVSDADVVASLTGPVVDADHNVLTRLATCKRFEVEVHLEDVVGGRRADRIVECGGERLISERSARNGVAHAPALVSGDGVGGDDLLVPSGVGDLPTVVTVGDLSIRIAFEVEADHISLRAGSGDAK